MKTLFLLRHAKSSWSDDTCSDHDRPLADRGREAAPLMAAYMQDHDLRADEIWVSTATRTQQTYELMQTAFAGSEVHFLPELYGMSSNALIDLLSKRGGSRRSILVLGHNPCMEMTAWSLLQDDQIQSPTAQDMARKFPTCALAQVEVPIEAWRDLAVASGSLVRFVKPKAL